MKIKCLAILGALLLAAPASAATVTETANGNKNNFSEVNSTGNDAFSLIAGVYDFALTASLTGQNSGSISATLTNLSGSISKLFTLTFTNGGSKSASDSFNLAADTYKINWGTAISGGSFNATANLASQPVPVPGPEAGAGLGALAMAGLAYAVSRRRRLGAIN